jgi:hypothetical protein
MWQYLALSCNKVIFFNVAKGSLSNRESGDSFRKGQYIAGDNFRPSGTQKVQMRKFPMN